MGNSHSRQLCNSGICQSLIAFLYPLFYYSPQKKQGRREGKRSHVFCQVVTPFLYPPTFIVAPKAVGTREKKRNERKREKDNRHFCTPSKPAFLQFITYRRRETNFTQPLFLPLFALEGIEKKILTLYGRNRIRQNK